ncbi:MAG: hypothetical protein AAGI37_06745 [Planctomycetota bacterium]
MSEAEDQQRLAKVTELNLYRKRAEVAEQELATLRKQMKRHYQHSNNPFVFPTTTKESVVVPKSNTEHGPQKDYTTRVAIHHPGMALRDYFAAKAMQAIIAKLPIKQTAEYADGSSDAEVTSYQDEARTNKAVAIGAYKYADAMLKAGRS